MAASEHPRVVSPAAVDRESELALIERALDAALAGTPKAVLISGEAGIGKTRLVTEALRSSEGRDRRVVKGSCLALGRDIPYLPFVEMLRSLVAELPMPAREAVLGPAARELALLLPELAPRRAAEQGRSGATAGRWVTRDDGRSLITGDASGLARLRLFEGLLRVTERLAAHSPVVAIFEDIQWADEASLALLAYLWHGLRRGAVLLLLTMRTEEAGGPFVAFLADLERDERIERVDLSGFSLEQTGQQLAAILGHRPEPATVLHIYELSGGNPFFAEELLAAERSSVTATAGALSIGALSPRLRHILRARMAQLPAEAQTVLRAASTTARPADGGLLAAACGIPTTIVEQGLHAALEEQVLVRVGDGQAGGYRFRHELMRAYVASELLPTEASRLHAAFASAISAAPDTPRSQAELAYHWDAAGDVARAFVAHVEAGLEAEAAFAFEVAFHHFDRALELWHRVPAADDRIGLERPRLAQRSADAAGRAGHLERAIELARSVLAAGDADTDLVASMRSSLRWYLWQSGRTEEAVEEAERALEALPADGSGRWQANALGHLAGLRLLTGDAARARRSAVEALALAEVEGAWEEGQLARGILGWCHVAAGDVEEGIDEIRAVWKAAVDREQPHLTGIALAYGQLAIALELAGRLDEAMAVATDGASWASRHGLTLTFGRPLEAIWARCLYHLGRWDEASAATTSALPLGQLGPGSFGLAVVGALLGAARGPGDAIVEALAAARTRQRFGAVGEPLGWLGTALAERALWHDDPEAALAWLGRTPPVAGSDVAIAMATTSELASGSPLDASLPRRLALAARAVADASLVDRATGRSGAERLDRLAEAIRSDLRRCERHRELAMAWRADLLCAHAELARATDLGSRGPHGRWSRAAAAASAMGRPYAEAYARWRAAEALVSRRGDRDAATREVGAARELATRLGAAPLVRELESLARRARLGGARAVSGVAASRSDGGPTAPFGLSEREREVLALVASGDSNREIGEKLFISPRTASVHVSNILGKMGASSRVEAATLALRLGLVTDEGG